MSNESRDIYNINVTGYLEENDVIPADSPFVPLISYIFICIEDPKLSDNYPNYKKI